MADSFADPRCEKKGVRDFTNNVVKIKVGREGINFVVHEKPLRAQSEFFDTALKKEWQEHQERQIELLEEGAETFSRFLEWLYSGRIACRSDKPGHDTLVKLYVLGEVLLAADFQNAIIDSIVAEGRHYRVWPGWKAISALYAGTPSGSPARKLMVDICTSHAVSEWTDNRTFKDTHPECLADLVRALIAKRPLPNQAQFENLDTGAPKAYYKSASTQK